MPRVYRSLALARRIRGLRKLNVDTLYGDCGTAPVCRRGNRGPPAVSRRLAGGADPFHGIEPAGIVGVGLFRRLRRLETSLDLPQLGNFVE